MTSSPPRKKIHTSILFQNVNSLELSSGRHTLELMCDSIGQLKIAIVFSVETNAHWKQPRVEASLKATTKIHW